jgi:dihydrofolate reductase
VSERDGATEQRCDEGGHAACPSARVSIIAAMSENRVIGVGSELPWRLPDEMKRFRELTTGHAVVLGRRTNDSIGRPLPNRRMIVISRGLSGTDLEIARSLDDALALVTDDPEVFVIGGAEIYRLALPRADRLYLTTVHATLEGDVFFPEFDRAEWRLVDEKHHPADDRHAYAFTMATYDRVVGE